MMIFHPISIFSRRPSMQSSLLVKVRCLISIDVHMFINYSTVRIFQCNKFYEYLVRLFILLESSPIRYHSICRNHSTLLCFRDDHYLCLCVDNHTRVECFLYNDQLDRCSHCSSGGRCLRGDHNRFTDFICLCPLCYSGEQCQFSLKIFHLYS